MIEALFAWLALGPNEVAAGVGNSEDFYGRGSDGDVHQILSRARDNCGLDCGGTCEASGTCNGAEEGIAETVEVCG